MISRVRSATPAPPPAPRAHLGPRAGLTRQDHRRDDPRRRRRGHRAAHHRRHRRRCTGDVDCRPDRLGHHGLLWNLPVLARDGLGRTAQAPPEPPVRIGGHQATTGSSASSAVVMQLRDDPPAACPGLGERRCRRRHGTRADGRHGRHGRELRSTSSSTRRVHRWCSPSSTSTVAVVLPRTRRLRARRDRGRHAGAADIPPPVHGR